MSNQTKEQPEPQPAATVTPVRLSGVVMPVTRLMSRQLIRIINGQLVAVKKLVPQAA